jgi:hypothetical protein
MSREGGAAFTTNAALFHSNYFNGCWLDASRSPLNGKVTLSAPPILVTNFLVNHLADFRRANPGIQLSISGDIRPVSLSRSDLRRSPPIRAVMDFLLRIVAENPVFAKSV